MGANGPIDAVNLVQQRILQSQSDEEIAKRIRMDVAYLTEHLKEAQRRGISVVIAAGYSRALQWPQIYLSESDPVEVRSISKNTTVTL